MDQIPNRSLSRGQSQKPRLVYGSFGYKLTNDKQGNGKELNLLRLKPSLNDTLIISLDITFSKGAKRLITKQDDIHTKQETIK